MQGWIVQGRIVWCGLCRAVSYLHCPCPAVTVFLSVAFLQYNVLLLHMKDSFNNCSYHIVSTYEVCYFLFYARIIYCHNC